MNEQKCYELLGFGPAGNPDTVMTIGSLNAAIVKSIDFRLTNTTEGIEEFKLCALGPGFMALKRGDKLLFLTVDDGYLEVSDIGEELFSFLSTEGKLREVVNEAVVTELERLRAQAKADRLLEVEKREIAERDRLIAKYGLPSTDVDV